jgi:hypothetical protein
MSLLARRRVPRADREPNPASEGNGDPLLEAIAWLMDGVVRVPGTRLRFGLDAAMGLLPGVGDAASGAVQTALVLLAIRRYRPPRVVVARMVTNVLLDSILGGIPLVGDLFDLGYRASSKNMRLLQDVSERRRRGEDIPTAGSVGFLVAVALVLVGGLTLTILGAVTLVAWLLGRPLF